MHACIREKYLYYLYELHNSHGTREDYIAAHIKFNNTTGGAYIIQGSGLQAPPPDKVWPSASPELQPPSPPDKVWSLPPLAPDPGDERFPWAWAHMLFRALMRVHAILGTWDTHPQRLRRSTQNAHPSPQGGRGSNAVPFVTANN